ncbi:AAA family ATPase [Paenibacillus soyae]|uniref:Nuclease SbcCD subunit C n=1 Tax=Paenibacillus soyae TaxID=2969249 RepID=A0A9X2MSH0_9BACL|nr:AAA family ATPase [Paenibacillus soyae]MCR2805394.1 AAA family ATPase [Paenibacillus soyae]
MIINKIKFHNFMAYYGEVEFDLSIDEQRNVTIIYAPNDVGKTCFFNGIMFCLYGPSKGTDLTDLINKNAFQEGKYEAYVSIFAEHQGNELNITRTVKKRGMAVGEVTSQNLDHQLRIWKNGEEPWDDNQETYDYINSIIHKDAAKYFFFDGEKIETYNIASGADYKDAILRILGIKEIEFAIDDFKRLIKEYEKERDVILSKENEGNELVQQKNMVMESVESYETDVTACDQELKDIQARIVKLEEQLKENEAIKQKIEERQKIREQIKQLKLDQNRIEEDKLKLFRENGTLILGSILANDLKPTVADLITEPNSILPSRDFIQQLLEETHCVCGTEMTDLLRGNLQKTIGTLAEKDLEWQRKSERKRAIQGVDIFSNHSERAKVAYDELCKNKVRINRELNELEAREIELRSDVGNYNEAAVQRLAEEIARLEEKNKEVEKKKITYEVNRDIKRSELTELEKKIAKHNVSREKDEAEKKLVYCRSVYNALVEYQDTLIEEKRKEVENNSSHIFLQLTNKRNKYKSLKLSDTYELLLEQSDGSLYRIERGRSLNPSTGQSKIISLSYIAGINKSTNAVAPVIIDNPVGLFSEEHRERVVSYLPNFGKQVIFMVTGADLGAEYRRMIEPYVSRAYYLEDQSDLTWNKTRIARVEELNTV